MASYNTLTQIGVGWRQLLANAVRQSMCATLVAMQRGIDDRVHRIEGMEAALLEEQRKMNMRWLYVLATKSHRRQVLGMMERTKGHFHAASTMATLPQRIVFRVLVSALQQWRVASALLFAESRCNAWSLMQVMTVTVGAYKRATVRVLNKHFHLWFRFSLAEVHREALELIVELPQLLQGGGGGGPQRPGHYPSYQRGTTPPLSSGSSNGRGSQRRRLQPDHSDGYHAPSPASFYGDYY
jgi:hypothetical protein